MKREWLRQAIGLRPILSVLFASFCLLSMNQNASALATLTSMAKLLTSSSRNPWGAPAPAWQAVQMGVNTLA